MVTMPAPLWPKHGFQRIAIVIPHPDDEIFSVGLARRAVSSGVTVSVVCATRGEKGRLFGRVEKPVDVASHRSHELASSCERIGTEVPIHLDLEDCGIDASSESQIEAFATALGVLQPDVVVSYGEDGGYGHRDHVMVARLLETVRRTALPACDWFQLRFPVGLFSQFTERLRRHAPSRVLPTEQVADVQDDNLIELTLSADEISAKRAVIDAHASQLRRDGCFLFPELESEILQREFYFRVGTDQ